MTSMVHVFESHNKTIKHAVQIYLYC